MCRRWDSVILKRSLASEVINICMTSKQSLQRTDNSEAAGAAQSILGAKLVGVGPDILRGSFNTQREDGKTKLHLDVKVVSFALWAAVSDHDCDAPSIRVLVASPLPNAKQRSIYR